MLTTSTQGSLTATEGKHTFKAGLLTDEQESNESYNLIPASQLAVNALAAVDPRLLPAGTPADGRERQPVMDALGNQVYQLAPNPVSPTVTCKHTGFIAPDTFRTPGTRLAGSPELRAPAGLVSRPDVNLADATVPSTRPKSLRASTSPTCWRQKTLFAASYNRLFTQPPLSQAATLGLAIPPQTGDCTRATSSGRSEQSDRQARLLLQGVAQLCRHRPAGSRHAARRLHNLQPSPRERERRRAELRPDPAQQCRAWRLPDLGERRKPAARCRRPATPTTISSTPSASASRTPGGARRASVSASTMAAASLRARYHGLALREPT